MTQISIKVKGAELVSKGLENLSDEIPKISSGRIRGRLESARTKLRRYPPQTNNPQPFKTDRQRRFFFAALRDGRIVVPYQRTRNLADGWTVEKRGREGYALTNSVGYTRYVHGSAYGTGQAGYHAGNWQLTRDVVEEAVKGLPEEIEDNIVMVARRNNL